MSDISDPLKQLNEIFTPDRDYWGESIEDRQGFLDSIRLDDHIPNDIRQMFETAKNISLYSYFAYQLHQPAEQVALVSLEAALKEKAELEKVGNGKLKFYKLIDLAFELGWLSEDDHPNPRYHATEIARRKNLHVLLNSLDGEASILEPTESQVQEILAEQELMKDTLDRLRGIRNMLSHDSHFLKPSSMGTLEEIAVIINAIFKNDRSKT